MTSENVPESTAEAVQALRILRAFERWIASAQGADRVVVLTRNDRGEFSASLNEHRTTRGATLADASAQAAQAVEIEAES